MGIWATLKQLFAPEKQTNMSHSPSAANKPAKPDRFERYLEAYDAAEILRKAGRGSDAKILYDKALNHVETCPNCRRDRFVPPAPYVAYAKMLYHMGFDDDAVAVLDRYIKFNAIRDEGFQAFRKEIATGKMRRFRNKYT
jgi:hypothetical protein